MNQNQSVNVLILAGSLVVLCLMMTGLWYVVRDAQQRLGYDQGGQTASVAGSGAAATGNQSSANVTDITGQVASDSVIQEANGLRFEALLIYEDAWPLIRAENQFNDPPLEGRRMLMVKLRITNVEGVEDPLPSVEESDFELLGEQNEIYNTYGDSTSCGVVPSAISGVIPPDDWISGNVCFQIPNRPQSLTFIYKPYISDETLFEIDLAQVESMEKYAVK